MWQSQKKTRCLLEQVINTVPKLWKSTILIPLVLQKAALLWHLCTKSIADANFAVYLLTLLRLLPVYDNSFQNFLSSSVFTPPNQNSILSGVIFFLQETAKPDTPPQGSSLTAFPYCSVTTQDKFHLISESSLDIALLFNKKMESGSKNTPV